MRARVLVFVFIYECVKLETGLHYFKRYLALSVFSLTLGSAFFNFFIFLLRPERQILSWIEPTDIIWKTFITYFSIQFQICDMKFEMHSMSLFLSFHQGVCLCSAYNKLRVRLNFVQISAWPSYYIVTMRINEEAIKNTVILRIWMTKIARELGSISLGD